MPNTEDTELYAKWDALTKEIERLREALTSAQTQLAVGRRFLPKHGSFGEEGINAYEAAMDKARVALESKGGT